MAGKMTIATLLVAWLAPALVQAGPPIGIGTLGDSITDEYQFEPDRKRARNWVEILAEARGLNFGSLGATDRGEPRRQGYEFNWARTDATTDDLIAQGQHTGLAAQVARGEVDLVLIFIGNNDFLNLLGSDDLPDPARLERVAARAIANFDTAITTILAASRDVKVVAVTVPNIQFLPEFSEKIRAGKLPPDRAAAFTRAIRRYNAHLKAIAAADVRVAVADLFAWGELITSLHRITVDGITIDQEKPGTDLMLGDGRHLGTVGQGLLANLFLTVIDAEFGAGIKLLSREEMTEFAASVSSTPTSG